MDTTQRTRPGSGESNTVHVVLVPGFWLGAWAWDDVVPPLLAAGLVPHPVTLPGLESPSADRGGVTRADHVLAVQELVASLTGPVVLVGHSGGGPVVQQAVDAEPDRVRRVVYVDTGPLVDGAVLNAGLPASAVDHPLPSWPELAAQGSSTDGIDEAGLERFRRRAVPHPARVASEPIRLTDPRRLEVPATVICTSLPSGRLRELAHPGPPLHTELGELRDLTYVDLPTGHWPMFSRPAELAAEIARAAMTTSGAAGSDR